MRGAPKGLTVKHYISIFVLSVHTDFLDLKMPFYFAKRGACSQAAHNCYQIFWLDFTLLLFVVQGEAFFELCREKTV